MLRETGASGAWTNSPVLIRPSCPSGLVWPSPVANRRTGVPRAAALVGPFTVPSELMATTSPVPVSARVNTPGAVGATGMENAGVILVL